MKKMTAFLVFVLLAMPLAAAPALAHNHGGGCPMKAKGGCSRGEKSGCPIVGMFMKKAHFFLENKAKLGLSAEQVSKIKTMRTDMVKTMIRNKAEQQIFMLDMQSKLSEPDLDVEGMNAMIDQAMAGMSTGAKGSVAALAELKGVLTAEQMTKAKEILRK